MDYARQIIALHDEAMARLTLPTFKTFVRLGILEELGNYRLPAVLHSFAKVFPDAKLQVDVKLSNRLMLDMWQGRNDIIVIAGETDVPNSFPLWSEQLVWVTSSAVPSPLREPVPLITLPDPCFLPQRSRKSSLQRRPAMGERSPPAARWREFALPSSPASALPPWAKLKSPRVCASWAPIRGSLACPDANVMICYRDKAF